MNIHLKKLVTFKSTREKIIQSSMSQPAYLTYLANFSNSIFSLSLDYTLYDLVEIVLQNYLYSIEAILWDLYKFNEFSNLKSYCFYSDFCQMRNFHVNLAIYALQFQCEFLTFFSFKWSFPGLEACSYQDVGAFSSILVW